MKKKRVEPNAGLNRDMSRRNFVSKAALAGLGLAITPMAFAVGKENTIGNNKNTHEPEKIMKIRKLGTLEVSELGAGCMSIMANYGPPADKAQGIKVIRAAYENGVRFFDTAEVYGPYTDERLAGKHWRLSAAKLPLPPSLALT